MPDLRRRLALRLLRPELEGRIAAARKLSEEAYQTTKNGRSGRAWWNGYEHALQRLIDGEEGL